MKGIERPVWSKQQIGTLSQMNYFWLRHCLDLQSFSLWSYLDSQWFTLLSFCRLVKVRFVLMPKKRISKTNQARKHKFELPLEFYHFQKRILISLENQDFKRSTGNHGRTMINGRNLSLVSAWTFSTTVTNILDL